MLRMLLTSGQAKGEVLEIHMRDYKEVDGLYFSHTMEQKIGEKSLFSFTADKVEFNVEEVDKAFFEMPTKE